MRFSTLIDKISPQPPVGGLEISDSIIRLAEFKKGAPVIHVNRLPPGVVEAGRLKDKTRLIPILKGLAESSGKGGKLGVVLTVPSNNVFIQTVNLPPLAIHNFEEAARLNIQMVSPLRQGEFYYDWQRTAKGEKGGSVELLGAFVSRNIVNDFSICLKEAGFNLVAVEFISLSLVRMLARKEFIKADKPYLIVEIRPEGITFMLVSMNQLLFHSFHNWGSVQGEEKTIKVPEFLATLVQGVNSISNFYLAHWGGPVTDLVFISSELETEIRGAFKDKTVLFLKPEEILPAVGAAFRSLSGDLPVGGKEINLLGTSSLEIMRENRALVFLAFWRNILAATLGFLLLLSLGADLSLRQLKARTMEVSAVTLNEPGHQELLALKEEASKFNELVGLLKEVRGQESQIGSVARLIYNLAGVEIRINRLYIPSLNEPITVSGVAANEQAAIAFKNRLARETSFTAVELPLSGITSETEGRVGFTVYVRIAGSNTSE